MKFQYIIVILICALPQQFLGQFQIESKEAGNKFSEIGQETILVHFNDNLLFAGEQLYYKIYCLNAEKYTLSELSKIAYIELVNSDRKQIFKHKIKLSSGIGQGDFFIPASVASGSYKLVAYTQWMRNFGRNLIFTADLSIINPYLEGGALNTNLNSKLSEQQHSNTSGESIQLRLSKTEYGSREEVVIKVENTLGISGDFSIAIRKKQPFTQKAPISFENYHARIASSALNPMMPSVDSVYLPETRGEIFSGVLHNTKDERPISGEVIAISIPESDRSTIKFSKTNSSGQFFTIIDDPRLNSKINISSTYSGKQRFRFINTTNPPIDYSHLEFPAFEISVAMQQEIIDYSIQNQIENAYIQKRSDSIIYETISHKVYEDYTAVYVLDDYNRFPTLRETIVEIIDDVFIKKTKGRFALMLRADDEFFVESTDLPLVLVDGKVLNDIGPLLSFGASNIERISLTKGNHYLGPVKFHGIISIKTKKANFPPSANGENSTIWDITAPLPQKKYFVQSYDSASLKSDLHLPDFRKQLLWEPQFNLSSEDREIRCFTSDVKGNFEIRLEGFTKNGKPISAISNFRVE